MLRAIERRLPDWLWDPTDHWSRAKGYGRMVIFLGIVAFFADWVVIVPGLFACGILLYGIGLLGLRMRIERERKG